MVKKVKSSTETIRAYARISRKTEESQSIEQQRHKLSRWAAFAHEGAELAWYVDEGVSASRAVARPGRESAIADLASGDVLAVTKVDRLARSVRDLLDIVAVAETRGASVVFVGQSIDTAGPYGRFTLTLLGALAELEAGIISERITAAHETFNSQGRHGYGLIPWGFVSVRDPETGGKFVRPHPTDGPRLREALLAIIAGSTQTAQAELLGLPKTTFTKVVKNPRVYGKQPGGVVLPEAGVLSLSEWNALQTTLQQPRGWSRAPGYGPVVLCGGCGRRMYVNSKSKKGRGVYWCGQEGHDGNRRVAILRPVVDEAIEAYFLDHWGPVSVYDAVAAGDDSERQERLAAVDAVLGELGRAIASPGADRAALVAEMDELDREREGILAEPAKAGLHLRPVPDVADGAALWRQSTDEERIELLKPILRVTVGPHVPGGEPSDRLTFEPLVELPERYEWSTDRWRGRGMIVQPGEGVSATDPRFLALIGRG